MLSSFPLPPPSFSRFSSLLFLGSSSVLSAFAPCVTPLAHRPSFLRPRRPSCRRAGFRRNRHPSTDKASRPPPSTRALNPTPRRRHPRPHDTQSLMQQLLNQTKAFRREVSKRGRTRRAADMCPSICLLLDQFVVSAAASLFRNLEPLADLFVSIFRRRSMFEPSGRRTRRSQRSCLPLPPHRSFMLI